MHAPSHRLAEQRVSERIAAADRARFVRSVSRNQPRRHGRRRQSR